MFGMRHEMRETPVPLERRFIDPSVPSSACCCPARPVVKVTMPPTPSRPHSVDLWLCGHHYNASRAALRAAHATVEDLTVPVDQPLYDRAPAAA